MAVTHGPISSTPAASHGSGVSHRLHARRPAPLRHPPRSRRAADRVRAHLPLGLPRQALALGFRTVVSPASSHGPPRSCRVDPRRSAPPRASSPSVPRVPSTASTTRSPAPPGPTCCSCSACSASGSPSPSGWPCASPRAAGVVLYLLMWTVVLPPDTNPVVDDHILGALTVVALALLAAGDTWGLGRRWSRIDVVKSHPVLR